MSRINVCSICNNKFKGIGNSPKPVKKEGVCCDDCSFRVVAPARIEAIKRTTYAKLA